MPRAPRKVVRGPPCSHACIALERTCGDSRGRRSFLTPYFWADYTPASHGPASAGTASFCRQAEAGGALPAGGTSSFRDRPLKGGPLMKASRLRALFLAATAAFALAGAFVAPRAAAADEAALKDAMQAYRENRFDDALVKLREYIAGNPADDEVYALLRDVEERVLLKALSQGDEHERLMKYLLGKSRPPAAEVAATAEAIKAKVDQALNAPEFDVRRRAAMELRSAGE